MKKLVLVAVLIASVIGGHYLRKHLERSGCTKTLWTMISQKYGFLPEELLHSAFDTKINDMCKEIIK